MEALLKCFQTIQTTAYNIEHWGLNLNQVFCSRCILHAFKNLEMHSMDDVMYGSTNLVVFDQFDNTFSWVDELLVFDKM